MPLVHLLPLLAAAGLALTLFLIATDYRLPARSAWVVPAVLSLAFFGWSVAAGISEGPLGFWVEHTRNLWGNQIWFDLLIAAGTACAFIAPEARRLGMRLPLWLFLVIASGGIGLLAMVSRLLYLRARLSSAV